MNTFFFLWLLDRQQSFNRLSPHLQLISIISGGVIGLVAFIFLFCLMHQSTYKDTHVHKWESLFPHHYYNDVLICSCGALRDIK